MRRLGQRDPGRLRPLGCGARSALAARLLSWRPPAARSRPALPAGPYLIAGLGRAGLAAAPALARVAGAEQVLAWDAEPSVCKAARPTLEPLAIASRSGGDGTPLLDDARCLVKSPGIRPDAPVVRGAVERGLTVIDEAELGWRLEERPLIGVTGTNGKSTVAALLLALLRAAGAAPVLAGNTLFGPPLSALGDHPGDVIVAELSSFQLQYCPELVADAAVLTNVGDDHWDWHGGRAAYVAAKRRLFLRPDGNAGAAAVNVDEGGGAELAAELADRGAEVVSYGGSPEARYRVSGCSWTLERGSVGLEFDGIELALDTRLPGDHNALNIAAALAMAAALGIEAGTAAPAIAAAEPVPGRFELVGRAGGADVVVDYAHNPGGLRGVLSTLRPVVAARGGRIVAVVSVLAPVVDERQRREMGRVLGSLAELTVVTLERLGHDEPSDAPPPGLLEGLRDEGGHAEFVAGRRAAIERALELAEDGDAVVIVNRGARTLFRDLDDEVIEFDDRAVARELLGAGRIVGEPPVAAS